MPPTKLIDDAGKAVRLGRELGRGGEGAVYAIDGRPNLVAKFYLKSPTDAKAEKLRAMVASANPHLLSIAAWPTGLLREPKHGHVMGLVMPLVERFEEVHALYGPAHRRLTFPAADWKFLAQSARNCAAAFDVVHQSGHVIGDVNYKNVMVSENATVKLIDCDSYQIRHGESVFRCEVGVPEFTPPELQGRSFATIDRTPDHDRFGLAVLIFHLLFMGRHPFSGRFLGKGEMDIAKAIGEFRFAYGKLASSFQMEPPPFSLPMSAVPPNVAELFEAAFASPGGSRPAATQWCSSLDALIRSVDVCAVDAGHVYPKAVGECPWCRLMGRGAPNFFASVVPARGMAAASSSAFDLQRLWAEVQAIRRPDAGYRRPARPRVRPRPLPAGVPNRRPDRVLVAAGWAQSAFALGFWAALVLCFASSRLRVVACLLMAGAFVGVNWLAGRRRAKEFEANVEIVEMQLRHDEEVGRRDLAMRTAEATLAALERERAAAARQFTNQFDLLMGELENLRQTYAGTDATFAGELRGLEQNQKAAQLEQFLRSQFVTGHKIPNIGPGRKAVLQSYGIETAFDVTAAAIELVPGFGEKLTAELLRWRKSVAAGFQFNAAQPLPADRVANLHQKYAVVRADLAKKMGDARNRLLDVSTRAAEDGKRRDPAITTAVKALAQAEADRAMLV